MTHSQTHPARRSLADTCFPSCMVAACGNNMPGHRLGRQQVDAHDLALAAVARGHLQPAARGAAEVDDPLARIEELQLVVNLEQLVGRSPAVAVPLGGGDVGVVQLPLQPARRRVLPPARRLHPYGEITALARGATATS